MFVRLDKNVTIWHGKTPKSDVCAIGAILKKDAKNGIKQYGYHDASSMTVRIFTNRELAADIGDFIRVGICEGAGDRSLDFRITEVRDNRKGAAPHYKLICGR